MVAGPDLPAGLWKPDALGGLSHRHRAGYASGGGFAYGGLCLVVGVFCGGVAAKEFAEAEKGWWKEGITAFGFMTVSVMLCIYLIR